MNNIKDMPFGKDKVKAIKKNNCNKKVAGQMGQRNHWKKVIVYKKKCECTWC